MIYENGIKDVWRSFEAKKNNNKNKEIAVSVVMK